MAEHDLAQDASLARFSVDGHVCFIVPEDATSKPSRVSIVGSLTLGHRRYSICSDPLSANAAPTDVLTARELQIAVLKAQGFDKKAIGRRLGISTVTVGTHLARAYAKLGVASRRALAARIAGSVALHRRPSPTAPSADRTSAPT